MDGRNYAVIFEAMFAFLQAKIVDLAAEILSGLATIPGMSVPREFGKTWTISTTFTLNTSPSLMDGRKWTFPVFFCL